MEGFIMKFNSVTIKNFRNFEDISIDLTNKNVLFGMNDVGKTNFLYALRFIFDKEIRKQNFNDTDYYKKNVFNPIEIIISIDISDTEDADSQKLRAKLKGAILSDQNIVYIKVKADYNKKEMVGVPVLYWGGDIEDLEEMKVHGTFFEIDYVFNVIYIDAYVDLYALFKKNANTLLVNDHEQDKDILESIDKICDELNAEISGLSGIKAFEEKIAPEYKKFRHDDISVSVKSEIAVKGLYSNIVPYIKQETDNSLYPTSGEGRKKLLVYAIFDLLSKEEEEKKITIFLIEEPENHLHRSMQIALSHILFLDNKYQYLFITTHSPYVLAEMDQINLVRIYNEDKIVSRSVLYRVPTKFKSQRKMLNRGLVEAIFADKVLLVEGPSENVLFGKVLSEINPFYEADGIYILPVGGFGFKPYYHILDALQIDNIIKTDNDLRKIKGKEKYSVLGFSRLNNFTKKKILPDTPIDETGVEAKRKLYDNNQEKLDQIRAEYSIYLSRCSLEEDLDEIIHDQMISYLPNADGDVIGYLQDAKNNHMVELVEKLTVEDCKRIYEHYNFACLKEVMQ
jgi:predicted ATP-dependent endonuclease of OLD family